MVQVVVADSYYTPLTKVFAGLLGALTAFCIARYAVTRPPRLPAFEFALLLHYLAFGLAITLPALPMGIQNYTPRAESFELAAGLALASALSLAGGYACWQVAPRAARRRAYMPRLTPDRLVAASGTFVLLCAVFSAAWLLAPSLKERSLRVFAIVQGSLDLVPMMSVAAIAYALRPRSRTFAQLSLAVAMTGLALLVTSMIGTALQPAFALATLWWRLRGRLPWLLLLVAAAALVVLQPVKSYYRQVRWSDASQNVGVIDGWERAFSLAGADRNVASGSEAARERFSELASVAYVTEFVPASMPYIGGDAYEQTLIAIIPRVFWPDKPNMTKEGLDRYTIALGLTSVDIAERSTTGITLTAHGYMSHGPWGAVAWMALLGFVIGALERLYGGGIAGLIAMSTTIGWIPSMHAGFVACFGSLWQQVALSLIIVWLLRIIAGVTTASQASPVAAFRRAADPPSV